MNRHERRAHRAAMSKAVRKGSIKRPRNSATTTGAFGRQCVNPPKSNFAAIR